MPVLQRRRTPLDDSFLRNLSIVAILLLGISYIYGDRVVFFGLVPICEQPQLGYIGWALVATSLFSLALEIVGYCKGWYDKSTPK